MAWAEQTGNWQILRAKTQLFLDCEKRKIELNDEANQEATPENVETVSEPFCFNQR